jgi:hypothetical protein
MIKEITLLSALLFLLTGCSSHQGIMPFVTDGCSWFPDGSCEQEDLWLECCVDHDRAYWVGGTRAERTASDRLLKECVAEAGAPKTAALMRVGVWFGGTPYLPMYFRWGFGWPYPRGYKALTVEERQEVERRLAEEEAAK